MLRDVGARWLVLAIYALSGIAAVLGGMAGVVVPEQIVAHADMHLVREASTAVVFVGLMLLWCIPNFERRGSVHAFFLVVTFLLAAIHWHEFLLDRRSWISPVVNSMLFLVFLAITPWKGRSTAL